MGEGANGVDRKGDGGALAAPAQDAGSAALGSGGEVGQAGSRMDQASEGAGRSEGATGTDRVREEGAKFSTRRSIGEREVRYFAVNDVLCARCGLRGHMSWSCPEPEPEVRCFICGMPGHVSKDCQREVCYFCGEVGHKSRECPVRTNNGHKSTPRKQTPKKRTFVPKPVPLRCYVCNGEDHLDCSLGRPYPARLSCYNCGEVGHSGNGCHLPGVNATLQAVTRLLRQDDNEGGRRKRRRGGGGSGGGGGNAFDNVERQRELAQQLYDRIDEELGVSSAHRNRDSRLAARDNRHYRSYR